jgi:hypothetical protein
MHMPSRSRWDKDEHGNVVVSPVTGFGIRVVMMTALVARIEFRKVEPDGSESEGAVQLAMSPLIALQFAEVLTRKAGNGRSANGLD